LILLSLFLRLSELIVGNVRSLRKGIAAPSSLHYVMQDQDLHEGLELAGLLVRLSPIFRGRPLGLPVAVGAILEESGQLRMMRQDNQMQTI